MAQQREVDVPGRRQPLVITAAELDDEAGAVIWDAALVLIHYLMHQHSAGKCPVVGCTILEVGAGLGAVGLTAAALGARRVALTDLPHLLPHITRNIEDNQMGKVAGALPLDWRDTEQLEAALHWLHASSPLTASTSCSPSTAVRPPGSGAQAPASGPLRPPPQTGLSPDAALPEEAHTEGMEGVAVAAQMSSGSPPAPAPAPAPDIVIASDVVYHEPSLPALCALLRALCMRHTASGQAPEVILAYELRDQIHATFCRQLQRAGLRGTQIPDVELDPQYTAVDIRLFRLSAV